MDVREEERVTTIDVPPGNYLVTLLPDGGYRLWLARALTREDTGNDGGDPADLLTIYFANLNGKADQEIAEALAEEDDA